jgi:hypothetical protein
MVKKRDTRKKTQGNGKPLKNIDDSKPRLTFKEFII